MFSGWSVLCVGGLIVPRCSLFVVCGCMLSVVCCMMFGVCCLVFVDG